MSLNWTKPVHLKSTLFTALATDDVKNIIILDDSYYIADVYVKTVTDWAGTDITAVTFEIGVSGSTTKYMSAKDVFTGVANTFAGSNIGGGAKAGVQAAGTALIGTIRTTGGDAAALTAGEVEVSFLVGKVPQL